MRPLAFEGAGWHGGCWGTVGLVGVPKCPRRLCEDSIPVRFSRFKHHSKALDESHLHVKFGIFAARIGRICSKFSNFSSDPGLPPVFLGVVVTP